MSDTNIHYLMRFRREIDVIDKDWEADALSDDEISIGKEMDVPLDDEEDEEMEHKDEEWNEMGVDVFLSGDVLIGEVDFGRNLIHEVAPTASLPQG